MIEIVIPVYNQEQYLPDAIESALAQTVKCNIIVVNDGSTDKSLEIAKKYPVKVIDQINKGLASARNTGIMNSTAEYILFLDADDILLENCVERILKEIEKTHADIIAPSFKNFGVLNNPVILQGGLTVESFIENNRIAYCTAIKREVLLEVGGYSPRMTWGYEDYSLWFTLLSRGKTISVIPEVLFLYRVKESSMFTEALKHHEELMAQIRKDHPQVFK